MLTVIIITSAILTKILMSRNGTKSKSWKKMGTRVDDLKKHISIDGSSRI
ncbi:hypothetical protein [Aurantibacter sp.]